MSAKHLFWAVALLSASVGFMKSERASDQASAAAIHVKCDQGATEENGRGPLQRAIDTSLPGASILVSGTCSENVTYPSEKTESRSTAGGPRLSPPLFRRCPRSS